MANITAYCNSTGNLLSQKVLNNANSFFYMPEKKYISKELIEKEYFDNNKSQDEIAKLFNVSQWVVSSRMKEYNLQSRDRTLKIKQRRYFVDDGFFDKIVPENAWLLGWLISDGFINRTGASNRFGINVSEKDSDIIYKIKKLLRFNGPVYNVKTKLKKTGKEYNQVTLSITSKSIVRRLKEFGIVANKSKNVDYPNLIDALANESITKSFIFGVFEGDGSILFDKKTKSPCFQIVGTKELLTGIQRNLITYLNINKTKLTRNTKLSNHFALRYRGRFQAVKILDWLYSNQTVYLDRKYNQYLNLKKELGICAV